MKLIPTIDETKDMTMHQVGNYGFSAIRPDKLGATVYTLVGSVTDVTGSISPFAKKLLEMQQRVIEACKMNPRAEFLILRSTTFSQRRGELGINEVHGFAELNLIDQSQLPVPYCTGMTNLFDAVFEMAAAINEYARVLADQDFEANGLIYVITDGDDNQSSHSIDDVKTELQRGIKLEHIESLKVILIGVNAADYKNELEAFKNGAGIDQYIEVDEVTDNALAKLGGFISKSISSQSQAVGTGGPSQNITF